jgi:hypothetical protein
MEGLFARVTVHVKNMQCDMHDSPALFYLLKGLKKREHQHDVKTPLANPSKNPVPLLTIPATSNFITDDVTVLREGISNEDGRTLHQRGVFINQSTCHTNRSAPKTAMC